MELQNSTPEQHLSWALGVFVYLAGTLTRQWTLVGNDLVWGPKASLAFNPGFG